MSLTTTTLGDILKEVYSPDPIEQQFYRSRPFLRELGDRGQVIGGENFHVAVDVEADESFAFQDESSAIPASSNQNVQHMTFSPKFFVGQVEMTGLAKDRSPGGAYSFANALMYHMDTKLSRMMVYMEGALFRDGTGLLGRINEPSSVPDTTGGALDIDTPGVVWLRNGQNIDIFASGSVQREATAKITEVERFNNQISLDVDVSSSISDNSRLFLSGTQTSGASSIASNEILGLADQVKTSGTINGLSISSYPDLAGNVIDASSADLTEDILQRAKAQIELRAGVAEVDQEYVLVMHPSQRRKYLDLVVPQHSFTGMSADVGYTNLSFNGWRFVVSEQAVPDEIYLINPRDYNRMTTPNGALQVSDDYDGGPWHVKNGFDAGFAILRAYIEYGLFRPNAVCRIESLATPTL